ncbi:MAG: FHA domain-containing protein [Anaerolineaceae bacterium]|nr:MAG: FHA domain-containing protein [Anaerolineaceae bacterium]
MSNDDKNVNKPALKIIEGLVKGRSANNDNDSVVYLHKAQTIIGRDDDCDVIVLERDVSRHHACLHIEGDNYFIEDLNSRNGTQVNDIPITGKVPIFSQSEIVLAGQLKLRFYNRFDTMSLKSVPTVLGGLLRIDMRSRRVFIGDDEILPSLSLPQYRLLELLYNNHGNVCTRDEVVQAVWPDAVGEGVSEQAIDALVRRLRDRLADYAEDKDFIITVRGHGFRLANPSMIEEN